MAKKTILEQQLEDKKENEILEKFGRKKKSLQQRKREAFLKRTKSFRKTSEQRYPFKPVNTSYKKIGNMGADVTLKTNIDLKKIAQLAAKRRNIDKISGKADKKVSKREVRKKLRAKKEVMKLNRKEKQTTNKLQTKRGEYVLIDGTDYEGYYHLHPGGKVMTEAVYRSKMSQPLVLKSDYLENLYVYKTLVEKTKYKNPYTKNVDVRIEGKAKTKSSTANKGVGSIATKGGGY